MSKSMPFTQEVAGATSGYSSLAGAVSAARWRAAQAGEAQYWEHARSSLREQARILAEKFAAVDQVTEAVPELCSVRGQRVEVGIGPLGIGMLHFLAAEAPLVGVDPLPIVFPATNLPRPLLALIDECHRNYTHFQARGESLPVEPNSTAIAACYNVLDHVASPRAVLSECFRILQPGGFFILGCDTVSVLSLLKFRLYTRWRDQSTLAVICHPFRFRAAKLERLVRDAGFEIVWVLRRSRERWERLVGRSFRLLFVAKKPSFVSAGQPSDANHEDCPTADDSGEQRGVLVSHPGGQHEARLAGALHRARLLHRLFTGFYWNSRGAIAGALYGLPGQAARRIAQKAARRSLPELPPKRIAACPFLEGAYLLAKRGPLGQRYGVQLLRWRNHLFDRSVAQSLERESPAAVVCFDSCAVETFRAARHLGIRTILDQSIAPVVAVREIYERKEELWPDFSDSMPRDLSPARLARDAEELQLADCILAPSPFVRDALENQGVPSDRIADVPFGVDLATFKPGPLRRSNGFRILFVGKLTQRKGLSELLEALRRLRLPGARLELVGDLVGSGRWLPRYRNLFERRSALGQTQLAERYRLADVFVLPSLHEGSALVTYEALASGLPVITTWQTGSVVRDGVEGFLVPAGEIDPLCEKLVELFQKPDLREQMGIGARRRAEEYSWEAYGRRLVAAIHRSLSPGAEVEGVALGSHV